MPILSLVPKQRLLRFKIEVSTQKINPVNFDKALVSYRQGDPFHIPVVKDAPTFMFGLFLVPFLYLLVRSCMIMENFSAVRKDCKVIRIVLVS